MRHGQEHVAALGVDHGPVLLDEVNVSQELGCDGALVELGLLLLAKVAHDVKALAVPAQVAQTESSLVLRLDGEELLNAAANIFEKLLVLSVCFVY